MSKVKFPIWLKLSILTLSLVIAVASYIGKSSYEYFETTLLQREEFSNITETRFKNNQAEQQIQNLIDRAISIGKDLREKPEYELTDSDILNLEVWNLDSNSIERKVSNLSFLDKNKLNQDFFQKINKNWSKRFEINNVSEEKQMIAQVSIPFIKNEQNQYTHFIVFNFNLISLQKNFSMEDRSGFILNDKYQFLASSDEKDLLKVENKSAQIRSFLKDNVNEKQFSYKENGQEYVGSLVISPHFGIKTFIQTNKKAILEPAINVRNKIIYMTSVIFSIALFLVYFFSASLTRSITILNELVQKVAQGDFSVKSKNSIKTFLKDETTELAENFDKMTTGLTEREKFKNIIHKFHGQSVSEDLMNKDSLVVGGEKKEVCVFFSDIRGFTAFSENTSPERVVSMLNEYFEVMVSIITKRGGIVDKFIGDAIMAVWGAPQGSEKDAYNATMACLEMRQSLNELNQKRINRGESPIMIGMGLHTGSAISGIIGSSEKMEYTVIGDTVNVTSRLESSTKSFGTDLLISSQIMEKIKDHFIISKAGEALVKGKSEQLSLYKVNGLIENGQPKLIQTPYSSYESEEADKIKKIG